MAGTNDDEIEAPQEAPVKPPKAANPWLPVVAVILLVPGISFGLTQFVLIPRIKGAVAESPGKTADAVAKKTVTEKGQKTDGKPEFSYEFPAIVVNLNGTMGTRYLKVTFTVFSSNQDLQKIMADNRPQLLDVALGVLSSRTLADLEVGGAKNLVRNDLVANFNQALNSDVVTQIYFSEFVVQ